MKIIETYAQINFCFFILKLSQDDKTAVNTGITAAKRQSCILMNLTYRVRVLDHDFP